ncbi:MAG: ABC transporter substrate-binding protein [Alphaproteobacteria bacterium]|nr:ABC transporter substrate-binding protein [Alphaproteobacteria bacterium]
MIEINGGFLPLTDSAILVVAKEKGFAEDEGIALKLARETSWANIRDRLAVEQFEIAHSLAPMPIAANLGLTPFDTKLIAPMALGLGGNAITVSNAVFDAMATTGDIASQDARQVGLALAQIVKARGEKGQKPLQFGVVHPFSAHNFELRYWLAGVGIQPDKDIDIVVLPPVLMADALKSGRIDGFCVGEPWNSVALARKAGKIATTKSAIWASSPEKVLAVNAIWAERNGPAMQALLRAFYAASIWCGEAEHVEELAELLAKSTYLDQPVNTILPALNGGLLGEKSTSAFFEPHARAATFPWQSHALWFYSQMVRWGHVAHSDERALVAQETFRPDIYRAAIVPTGASVPSANSKVEGALRETIAVGASSQSLLLGPDGFFDDRFFDPDHLDLYIRSQTV